MNDFNISSKATPTIPRLPSEIPPRWGARLVLTKDSIKVPFNLALLCILPLTLKPTSRALKVSTAVGAD